MKLSNEEATAILKYLYSRPYSEVVQLIEMVHKSIQRERNELAAKGEEKSGS